MSVTGVLLCSFQASYVKAQVLRRHNTFRARSLILSAFSYVARRTPKGWFLGAAFLLVTCSTAHANEFLVTGAGVKLRDKPDANARVLQIVRFGTRVNGQELPSDGEAWTNVSVEGVGEGWIKAKYLSPHDGARRSSQYLQVALRQFDASRDNFGNLVELLNFMNEVLFDIPDPRRAKNMETLRVAVLSRAIELAKDSGNKEWLSKYTDEPTESLKPKAIAGPASPPPAQVTTGNKSPIVSDVKGNVNIIYGERDTHKLRITYWRLKGVAADFLVKGLLSPEWEAILGGQQEILNNSVLSSARSTLGLFASEPIGDILVANNLQVSGVLEDHEKLRTQRNLKVFLGGQDNFSLLFPDQQAARIIATTDHWPTGYSLFHVCARKESHPILWKFMTSAELETYEQRMRSYVSFIQRSDSNITYVRGLESEAHYRLVIDALLTVTKNKLPDDFLLVLATEGQHGGWSLELLPRQLEIEIAAIENASSKSIALGELAYSESQVSALLPYDEATISIASAPRRHTRPLVSGVLKPGEKLVVPTRVSFVSRFEAAKCTSPSYEGERVKFPCGFSEDCNYYKTRESLKENIAPKVTPRYTYGTAWKLISLDVDGAVAPLRQANFNGFNLYLTNEKGSCPFVYTRDGKGGQWVAEGHMLLGATARNRSRRETKQLRSAPDELKLAEHEDEIAYIKEIYVEETSPDGAVIRHDPDGGQHPFVVSRSHERVLSFSKVSERPGASYALTAEGYYIPLASLNFLPEFLERSPTKVDADWAF